MLNSVEFSQQLWHLNRNEMKCKTSNEKEDNVCRTYVSQWLLPMLSTSQSTMVTKTEFPIISKKIRDDVIGAKNQLQQPFRRSGYWTFIKVMLQLNLTMEFGDVNGKKMYKLVLLKFMAILANYYNSKMYPVLNVDVVSLMLAKLARRIEKLNNLTSLVDEECPSNDLPDGFAEMYNNVIDEVKLVIFKVRQKLDRQVTQLQTDDEMMSRLVPLKELDFAADVYQQLPCLRDYLEMRQVRPQSPENNERLKVKCYPRHLINSLQEPDVKTFDKLKNPVEIGIFLSDFENWILYALYGIDQCEPETLRSFSFAYSRIAGKHYKDDQLGYSRIVLTQMQILSLLDKIATQKHELFKKHRAGINDEIFDQLILPQYEDFELAHKLKKYFRKRSKPEYPSLLEDEKVTEYSFSSRFARKSKEMQKVRKRIAQSSDENIAKILQEWEMRREEVAKLRKKLETMDCDYTLNANGKRQHKTQCASCKLRTKVSNIRVTSFEPPLPEEEFEQNAVVFELVIPVEIACLRDVLYEVLKFLNEPAKKTRIYEKWIESDLLDVFNNSFSERVFLGTTSKGNSTGRTRTKGMFKYNVINTLEWRS